MKLSELDPSEVTDIPEKLTRRNSQPAVPPDDVSPSDLAPGQKIGRGNRFLMDDGKTYGPENDPNAPKDDRSLPTKVKDFAIGSVKSIGTGLQTIAKEAAGKGADTDIGTKTREVTRGVSDVMLGYPERIANSAFPELAAKRTEDNKNAPGYRDAGGVLGGAIPNPVGMAMGGAAKVATEMAPAALKRMATKDLNALSSGGLASARQELGPAKPTIKEIAKSEPILAKPNDTDASLKAIDDALDKRHAELDRRYQSATDKYVSDPNAPGHVVDDPTTRVEAEPMSAMRPNRSELSPEPRPLIEGKTSSAIPESVDDSLGTTQKIPRQPMRQLTDGTNPADRISPPVIEMRPNGSLEPSEMKASIISKANELERSSAPQSDAVHRIIGNLEREIKAETNATHDDPGLRWWRQKATDYQKIANKHAQGEAETHNQAAHSEVANVIRNALENHMKDPEVNRINGEVSALMRLKKVVESKQIREESPGNSPGKYGSRLSSYLKGGADLASIAASIGTHSLAPMIVPAAIHGGPIAASLGDRMIAGIASAAARGAPIDKLVAQALKSGISQGQVDSALRNVERIKQ